MGVPTRLPSGVSTSAVGKNMGNYPLPNPTQAFTYFNDFSNYAAADWTVTNTTSHAAIALTAGQGGQMSIAGGASSVTSDIGAIQITPANFNFIVGQQVWFNASIKATTALNDQLQIGLASSIAALAPTDGMYFNKAAASASVDFVIRKGSTSTTLSAVGTLVDGTFLRLGYYYNGKDTVFVYVNHVLVASTQVLTNLTTATALAPGFGIKAAATAPTTGNIVCDYITAAQDITR